MNNGREERKMMRGESKMRKVMIDKSCDIIFLCSLFIFLCSLFSCGNPLIQVIVGARTATFESNGGSRVESQTVFRDQPVRRPQNPARSGFAFAAWYSDNETFLQEWDFSSIPNQDITLYAKWIVEGAALYTVTFNSNGGDREASPPSRTVESGSLVTPPDENPMRDSFEFGGWYTDAECTDGNEWDFDTDTVSADITLYAKWEFDGDPVIRSAAITVITPIADAAVNNTASGEGSFTIGAVLWSPDDNPFKGGVEYTATVTLTANQYYVFAPELDSATVNGNDATVVTNTEHALTLSYTFPPTKTVSGIAITAQPKLSYTHGDTLDLSGIVVRFTYNDTTTEDFEYNDFASRGITASPAHGAVLSHSTHNDQFVTITYGSFEPLTTGSLTVDPKATTLTVDPITAQTYTGNPILPTVTVKDGAATLTLNTDYTVTYADNINAGTATVSITGAGNYAGSTGSAEFTINKEGIAAVAVTVTGPVKGEIPDTAAAVSGTVNFTAGTASWSPGDNPFKGGEVYTVSVILTAHENYAFASTLTSATVNGNDATVSNNTGNALTLSHTFAATDTRTIIAIAIKTQPTNLAYTHGGTLDLSGLVVTLTFDTNETEDFAFAAFVSENISASPANGEALSHLTHNNRPVVVHYGGETASTNNLTVNPKAITFNIDSIAAQAYTGSGITPAVIVRDDTTILTPDDYTVDYSSNTNIGTATVTITGAGNYAGSSGSATFTINKADPVVTWPANLTATYTFGRTLSDISLDSYNSGTGIFTWTTPTASVGDAGTRTHNMTFTPTDTANYNTLTQDVTVTVAKATGAVVPAPTATTIVVDSVTLNIINIVDQNVEYAYNTTDTAPTSGWQIDRTFSGLTGGTTYYFFARSEANENFDTGAASNGAAITTMQSIGITVTIDTSELIDPSLGVVDKGTTLSRSGAGGNSKTANVAITGTYSAISWEIFGPGESVSGTGASIPLSAEDVRYNSLGYHTVTVTVTVGGMPYQKSFRFMIVE